MQQASTQSCTPTDHSSRCANLMSSSAEPFFHCEDVRVAYDGADVLRGVTLRIEPGEIVGVIGPNGSGKSTLLRTLSGTLQPAAGRALLRGKDIRLMKAPDRARVIGVVQQQSAAAFAFTVRDVVAMGRHSHVGLLKAMTEADLEAVDWALERTDCTALEDRPVTELSGGELQRVVIARALAQQPEALLLDEPTNHLDINHQLEIGELLVSLNRDRGMTIVWVSHDLNLAAEFCRRIVVLSAGRVAADGPPEKVITGELLDRVYGVDLPVNTNPVTGRPHVLLAARGRNTQ